MVCVRQAKKIEALVVEKEREGQERLEQVRAMRQG